MYDPSVCPCCINPLITCHLPYILDRPKKVKYRKRAVRKNGTLWFFGDPQLYIFSAVNEGPLCSKIFTNCKLINLIMES